MSSNQQTAPPRTMPIMTSSMLGILLVLMIASPQDQPVDDRALRNAAGMADEWLTYGRDHAETRFSLLDLINTSNVDRLRLAWSYDIPSFGDRQEATPLVANGTIYGVSTWSVVFAVDARTGREKWQWDPWVNQAAVRPVICCRVANRGLAIYRDLVYLPVIDGRLQALNAETGRVVWETRVAFPQDGYTLTMAPRIADGKVIVGVSGGDYPTRGFFDAYDALTGHRIWRFYTVPGDPSKPFENEVMRRAAATWDGDWWTRGGGGAVWDGMAYDPEAGLVYVGTGNPLPWPFQLRSSKDKDSLYASSILAVDVHTGELRWHYQVVPGDNWDYDSVQQLTLADLVIGGRMRQVIMQASKNGFFYVLDRITGQFVSAEPFAVVNWAKGIDASTGRPIANDAAYYGADAIAISPGIGGAHNWAPMAFSPITGLVYVPTATFSSTSHAVVSTYHPLPLQPGAGAGTVRPYPAPVLPSPPAIGPSPIEGSNALVAWDPVAQQIRWRTPGGGSTMGGAVATAGGVVFQVIREGRFLAYSADSGQKLLDLEYEIPPSGPPITYAVDGKQYVAFLAGLGAPARDLPDGRRSEPVAPKLLVFALAED